MGVCRDVRQGEPSTEQPVVVGLDLTKCVFPVPGVDAAGSVVVRRRLRRSQALVLFGRLSPASWAWRRAPERVAGRES
jgi:hypothetical protein